MQYLSLILSCLWLIILWSVNGGILETATRGQEIERARPRRLSGYHSHYVPDHDGPDPDPSSSDSTEDKSFNFIRAVVECQRGMINMWYGHHSALPFGWRICDGQKGTPDMRNTFPVAAGTDPNNNHFPFWSTGGRKNITLTVDQLPRHSHQIWERNINVTIEGRHNHTAQGWIGNNGLHYHNAGNLNMTANGGHNHTFHTVTNNDGDHRHDRLWLTVSDVDDHRHKIMIYTQWAGQHDHDDDFEVDDENSEHEHHNFNVWISSNGTHDHELRFNNLTFKIPPHTHDVGNYSIDDHDDEHNHVVEGRTNENGTHRHRIYFMTDNAGQHDHDFHLDTTENGTHMHEAGTLFAVMNGSHIHRINESETLLDGDHEHLIQAFFECTWHTDWDDCKTGLAADKVEMKKSDPYHAPPEVTDYHDSSTWDNLFSTLPEDETNGSHTHWIPEQIAQPAGQHTHDIWGKTENEGEHYHGVFGEIKEDGQHYHNLDNYTEEEPAHSHGVWGEAFNTRIWFNHVMRGNSGENSNAWERFDAGKPSGYVTPDGDHIHIGNVWTSIADGNHSHRLLGGVLANGTHRHLIHNYTELDGGHNHSISGWIGNDGNHNHSVWGETLNVRDHTHDIRGYTSFEGDHNHSLEITVFEDGDHLHKIEGVTEEVGCNEPIDITPPFTSVWFICCVDDQSISFSASDEKEINQTWWTKEPDTTEEPETTEEEMTTSQQADDYW